MFERPHLPLRLLLSVVWALVAAACSSTTTSVSSPSGGKCDVSVTTSLSSAPAAGGSGTLSVTTARDCTWTATSDVDWVTIVEGGNGQGDGTSTFRVAENPQPAGRQTELRINDRRLAVSQAAACRYQVTPTAVTAPAAGMTADVRLETGADCAWTASSDAEWVRVAPSGSGPQTVALTVQANSGAARSTRVTIGGQVVTVTQGGACSFTVDPTSAAVAAVGGSVIVSVAGGAACTWTATTETSWLTVSRSSSAPGPATVTIAVAPNTGPARTGTATIAGATVTISQETALPGTACQIQVSSPPPPFPAAGGQGEVVVTATVPTCTWSATSNAEWLRIPGSPGGAGSGTVAFVLDANPGGERTATLSIADKTYTVTQSAASAPVCIIQLTVPAMPIPASGGPGSISVTASSPTCVWSVTSGAAWLELSGASNRTGSGTIGFSAEANSGAARSASLTVAGGETYSLSQEAAAPTACTYAISGSPDWFSGLGGSGTITVTTGDGCAWTAQENESWIALRPPADGRGTGTVTFDVSPGLSTRIGEIRIGTQVFVVRRSILPGATDGQ